MFGGERGDDDDDEDKEGSQYEYDYEYETKGGDVPIDHQDVFKKFQERLKELEEQEKKRQSRHSSLERKLQAEQERQRGQAEEFQRQIEQERERQRSEGHTGHTTRGAQYDENWLWQGGQSKQNTTKGQAKEAAGIRQEKSEKEALRGRFYDLKKHPTTGFRGDRRKLLKGIKNKRAAERWLQDQPAYTLFQPAPHGKGTFRRQHVGPVILTIFVRLTWLTLKIM